MESTNPTPPPGKLSAIDLGFSYRLGERVLDNLFFEIEQGEFVSLLGPSGSGKSTLLRLIAGLLGEHSGCLHLGDLELCEGRRFIPPEKRPIGLMFQDFALFPHMTVWQNLGFGLVGWPREEKEARVSEMLDRISLASRAKAFPHELSGGQQQRVALARALAPGPSLMLLDEPFTGLDRYLRESLRESTKEMLATSGQTTLMVTHDPDEALFMADRLMVLNNGKIEQMGTGTELYYSPNTPFVARFLGASNRFLSRVKEGEVAIAVGRLKTSLPEGLRVQVLLRPQALLLCPANAIYQSLPVARVVDARAMGTHSRIRLRLGQGKETLINVEISGTFLPRPDQRFAVGVNPEFAYIFPEGD